MHSSVRGEYNNYPRSETSPPSFRPPLIDTFLHERTKYMWRDKINEAKKAKNIRTKAISDITHIHEKAISRMLSGEAKNPCVDDVLAVGAAVGLTAIDLFFETETVLGGKSLVELQE